ncbi:FAD-dependent oxidoreductase [Vineibacter terrae]|uniref:FAD-dependent oxidoreductase n=1 Tax=Vineibacter terrae TaxID=2586908 RepID=UPI002E338226|nr:FAD-dependent oxidoreductase [Vineibacter terrae]HEX2886178.1 FAD-dependent oxidoreductase [Vineibacter terrae]
MGSYVYPRYAYVPPPELTVGACVASTYPVVIVGAGLVGLTLALDLALKGVPVTVLDEDDTVSIGSRSICQAQRTLEIWHRLGVADRMVAKGITWDTGEVYVGDRQVYRFNMQPDPGQRFPAFINLQQYYCEQFLVERCGEVAGVDLRFRNKVIDVRPGNDHVAVDVDTPDGRYTLRAAWLVACDGVRSAVRTLLKLPYEGEVFDDQFLIADIRMRADLPNIRKYWFYPPFHPQNSVLLHRQADDVLRVDFQLGRDADAEAERRIEAIDRRLRIMFGPAARWDHEWSSVYKFTCRTLPRFVHGRVIFAGDAAHVVSPFGARGGNSGVQDADNLGWKLALVIQGIAPASLLESYSHERVQAARENIRQSTRSTDFITPKFPASRVFRDAVLDLARDFPFARAMVNSGRLSRPTCCSDSPLHASEAAADWGPAPPPGDVLPDAPLADDDDIWATEAVAGRFAVVTFADTPDGLPSDAALRLAAPFPVACIAVMRDAGARPAGWDALHDTKGMLAHRCDARPGTTYLVRPDQVIAGRWRALDLAALAAGLRRAAGLAEE